MQKRIAITKTSRFIASPFAAYSLSYGAQVELCRTLSVRGDLVNLERAAERLDNDLHHYYLAIAKQELFNPSCLLNLRVPERYLPRVVLSAGHSLLWGSQEPKPALRLISEARALALRQSDSVSLYQASKQLAVLASIDGNHTGALRSLESLFPLVRSLAGDYPSLYFDYFNSLGVELMETGRLSEARDAVNIALASPFAPTYNDCRATANDIAIRLGGSARDQVAVPAPSPENVLYLPEPIERDIDPGDAPANVLEFKVRPMVNRKASDEEGDEKRTDDKAARKELRREIFEMISDEDLRESIDRQTLEKVVRTLKDSLKKKQRP